MIYLEKAKSSVGYESWIYRNGTWVNIGSDDINLNKKLDLNHRDTLKLWLITEMTKIKGGLYTPNEEQKQLLHEAKKIYNNLEGDSYVDTMFDNLVNAGLI